MQTHDYHRLRHLELDNTSSLMLARTLIKHLRHTESTIIPLKRGYAGNPTRSEQERSKKLERAFPVFRKPISYKQ